MRSRSSAGYPRRSANSRPISKWNVPSGSCATALYISLTLVLSSSTSTVFMCQSSSLGAIVPPGHSVAERKRAARRELKEGRRALDFGALDPRGVFKLTGLDTHWACEEPAALLDVLGVQILDRRRVRHRELVAVAFGGDVHAILGQPHDDFFAGAECFHAEEIADQHRFRVIGSMGLTHH